MVVVERDFIFLEPNGSKRISLRLFGALLVVVPAPGSQRGATTIVALASDALQCFEWRFIVIIF